MSDPTTGEGVTVEIARLRSFVQARLLPGTYTDNGVEQAAIYLIRPDNRTISAREIVLNDSKDGHLDNTTSRFIWWLHSLRAIKYISADCAAGMMSLVLFLSDGQNNPGLILLNALRERAGEPILTGTEIAQLAGIQGNAPYPGEINPAAARLAYKMEELLLAAANVVLALPPSPEAQ